MKRNLFDEISGGLKEIRDTKQLVQIRWQDACGVSANWEYLVDLADKPLEDFIINSVGFVLQETDSVIHIAPHIHVDGNTGQYCGDMQIPKHSIIDMWDIK